MAILGPTPNLDSLTKSLDPNLLVRLAADILAERGHKDIRITDGPGDGCRDVHSTHPSGTRHLTQCKYKEHPGKTVTNADVSELPIGLIKLAYRRGLFITNGRISPQAKREYLDNYSGYELDFLDGLALTREICDSALLLALWVCGDKLEKANAAISIPIIVRDLITDRRVSLRTSDVAIKTLVDCMEKRFPHLKCILDADASTHLMQFDPYRPPAFVSAEEGMLATLQTTELTFRGDVSRAAFGSLRDAIVEFLPKILYESADVPEAFAIRIGMPQIVPLSGSWAGAKYDIPEKPQTYWCTPSGTMTESAMLRPTWYSGDEQERSHGWIERSDARVSESSWVRLFHPVHDACVDCRITTTPSVEERLKHDALRAAHLRRWNESLFALVPQDSLPEFPDGLPVPALRARVGNGILLGWLHSELTNGVLQITGENTFSLELDPVAEKLGIRSRGAPGSEITEKVATALAQIKHKEGFLPPKMARHVLAFYFADPIPERDTVEYRTCDVLVAFDLLSSPLVPKCREIRLEAVWRNEAMPAVYFDDMAVLESLEEAVVKSARTVFGPNVSCRIDAERTGGQNEIALLRATTIEPPQLESTDNVLRGLERRLGEFFNGAVAALNECHPGWVLSTSWYWKRRYNVDLSPPPEGTDKIHLWCYHADGSLGAVYSSRRGFQRIDQSEDGALEVDLRPPVIDDEGNHSPILLLAIKEKNRGD